ncbi:MAG TPA: class I SAM-dependent DNA methyltransferase [Verrucomicrobiae bacterium]|nr:class I SAM-dependent DNA methyltransferase [Verrucomicrobiae bacterium]
MSTTTSQQLVQRLWSFCGVLRDDGLSYPDYVEQLTYLLFLKMVDERRLKATIPEEFSWRSLRTENANAFARRYEKALRGLSRGDGLLSTIFGDARNRIQDPRKLHVLAMKYIDGAQWADYRGDVLADAYEGLLDRTADDLKSGAGQYFTPRPLIDAMLSVTGVVSGETVFDPACGTGGFLLSAHNEALAQGLKRVSFTGIEIVKGVARLAAMNMLLHGVTNARDGQPIKVGDGLEHSNQRYSLIVTNPPFGKKSSLGALSRNGHYEGAAKPPTGNKQLLFLLKVMDSLKSGGRAAVVVPDNVLFEGGVAHSVRRRLMTDFNLHTILRLPLGIFYAAGIKASVIFFGDAEPRDKFRVYDLRTNCRKSLRKNPLSAEDLAEFVATANSIRAPKGTRWSTFQTAEILGSSTAGLDVGLIDDEGGQPREGRVLDAIDEFEAALSLLRELVTNPDQPR